MNNRVIAFIIAVILAIMTSYCQIADQLPSLPVPPVMEQPQVMPAQPVRIIPLEQQQSQPTLVTVIEESPILPEPPKMEELRPAPQEELTRNGINIGLSSQVRQKVATLLNKLLSDEYVLYTKTLKYHWNVQGIVFHDFHAMFKEQYEALFDIVDLVAERARALGAPALGSLQDFSANTRLKEINGQNLSPVQMVTNLLADHESIIRTVRVEITTTAELDDQGTSNLLQEIILKHEKFAWMLRATLQK